MIFIPDASPLMRILVGAFLIYVIPTVVDFLVLTKLLHVKNRVGLFVAALVANGVFVVIRVFIPVKLVFEGTQVSIALQLSTLSALLGIILGGAFIKFIIYGKMLRIPTTDELYSKVLASTVVGSAIEYTLLAFVLRVITQ